MRAELATVRQTLTPEAREVLTAAISEASRRGHGQTTPHHVAATLLASPSSMLRQACLRSHPATSHPLQCRALELCFSVAIDRLPKTSSAVEPPLSNALVAALKRAQAHQRRGCPEIQQQLLLAVRVDLQQLVVSILDDPSVSRVMREAGFSSPAVKAAIESKSVCKNLKLEALQVNTRAEEVKRVMEILSRAEKRNPVLVGDAGAASVLKEVLERVKLGEVAGVKARVVALGPEMKVGEVEEMIERERVSSGVVVDMGDLKWVMESGGAVVEEMTRVLKRFTGVGGGGGCKRVWVVGTATCETYLRCQVYHSCMERDWNLQPVSIASRSPLPPPSLFQRNGMVSSMGLRSGEQGVDASPNYEKCESLNCLPPWLQLATAACRPCQVNAQEANCKETSPLGSPKTDLVLGRTTKDIDTFKKLLQGITEMVSWQPEAAINPVMQTKPRGDKWLLFSGRDRVAKTKMVTALFELTFGSGPIYVNFGNDIELDKNRHGRQLVDRIVDTVKHNQFALIVVEDIDKADALVQGTIKHAIKHGRLIDSYGRESSLGNVIVILTAELPPEDLEYSQESIIHCEQKILHPADSSSHVEISLGKRKADWMNSSERSEKQRKGSCLSFDLNLAPDVDEDSLEASQNSSDITIENELISIKNLSNWQHQFLR